MEQNKAHVVGVRSTPDLASTLTTTLTGFLRPNLTMSVMASFIVALNKPVRLCFGRAEISLVKLGANPRSNSRSASSSTSMSSALTEATTRVLRWAVVPEGWFDEDKDEEPRRNSSRRPGVPMRILALVSRKAVMS